MPNTKIPRQAIYQSFKDSPGACPRCSVELIQEYQAYAVATVRVRKLQTRLSLVVILAGFVIHVLLLLSTKKKLGKCLVSRKVDGKLVRNFLCLGL
jgi:hypothetical protein